MEGFPYLTATLIDHQILMPLLNFGICIICKICTLKLCTKSINHYWIRRFRTILPDEWRGRTINVYFHFTPQVNTIVQTSLKVFFLKQESFLVIQFNMCFTYGTHFQSWTFLYPPAFCLREVLAHTDTAWGHDLLLYCPHLEEREERPILKMASNGGILSSSTKIFRREKSFEYVCVQGCISCGPCSYPELTEDHVLPSA